MSNKLEDLLADYWDAAYAEGKEGRVHDTVDGLAQRALSALLEHYAEIESRLAEVQAQRDGLKAVLATIRDNDWVENALDPQFAAGVAREALTKLEEKIK